MKKADVELKNDKLVCVIRPDLGASILELTYLGKSVLRSINKDTVTSARQSASFALIPFSNRMSHATLKWMGTDHPLIKNNADEPHNIHGVGWQRPWTILEQGEDFLLVSYEHKADGGWPFDFDASQAIKIKDNELHQTLSITNQSNKPTPVGLGWHPYFVKRKNSSIYFEASKIWEMGDDRLPTHAMKSGGLDQLCEQLEVDHCYDGWNGQVKLIDSELSINVSSNLDRLVVYTKPGMDSVAIEPVSHVNNAINMSSNLGIDANQYGIKILNPGETINAQMTINIQQV